MPRETIRKLSEDVGRLLMLGIEREMRLKHRHVGLERRRLRVRQVIGEHCLTERLRFRSLGRQI